MSFGEFFVGIAKIGNSLGWSLVGLIGLVVRLSGLFHQKVQQLCSDERVVFQSSGFTGCLLENKLVGIESGPPTGDCFVQICRTRLDAELIFRVPALESGQVGQRRMVQGLHAIKRHQGVFPSVCCVGSDAGVVLDMRTVGLKFGLLGQGVGNALRCTIGQLMLEFLNIEGICG